MKARTLRWLFCVSVLLAARADNAAAQQAARPIVIGEELTVFSEVLNEERTIYVGRPSGYDEGQGRYPVLLVLDGETHFHYTTALARFLGRNQRIPEMIVVSIANTERARDMTPPSDDPAVAELVPTHGGAIGFQTFIADELVPWLDERYRTRSYRILVGHSLGGLFAITSLITRPDVFDAYIAISPSLQWDSQRVVDRADAFFEQTAELNASLYMTAGNEGGGLVGGIRKLSGVLEEKAPAGFEWHFEHMPQETHGSVPHRSTYQGLEFVFSDWTLRDPFETYDRYGIEAVERFFRARDRKYGLDRGLPESVLGTIAVALESAGRLDEIMELLSRYRDTDALRPPPRFLMRIADRYLETGRAERAVAVYRQVLENDPENEAARQALTELGADSSELTR